MEEPERFFCFPVDRVIRRPGRPTLYVWNSGVERIKASEAWRCSHGQASVGGRERRPRSDPPMPKDSRVNNLAGGREGGESHAPTITYADLWDAFVAGAKEGRRHSAKATDHNLERAADAYTKLWQERHRP